MSEAVGTGVSLHGATSKRDSMWHSPFFTCICPNRIPMEKTNTTYKAYTSKAKHLYPLSLVSPRNYNRLTNGGWVESGGECSTNMKIEGE